MNFIVGAKGGYSVWKPYFKDIGGFFENIEYGTGVLYGPVLSAIFTEDLSLSVAGLTGMQSTEWYLDFEQKPDESFVRAGTYYWNSERYDLDSALSYRLFGSFKVFLGYKVQYIDSQMRQTEARSDPATKKLEELYQSSYNIKLLSQGPALGAGYAFVFGKGFFSTVNLSFLYMWGYFKIISDAEYEAMAGTSFTWTKKTDEFGASKDTRQMGVNFEPGIGYKAEDSGLIFTLGLRIQWLSTKILDAKSGGTELPSNTMNDYLGGIFVSVLYTF